MKKAYIMPLAEVVNTEAETMICASVTNVAGDIITKGDIFDGIDGSADGKDGFENVFEDLW